MKKLKTLVLGLLLAAALIFSPFQRTDVSELLPVRTIYLRAADGGCRIETDSGLLGQGAGLNSALRNLKQTVPGVAELSTAKQLVIEDGAESYAKELLFSEELRPGTELYRAPYYIDVTDAEAFLSRHTVETTAARVKAAELRGVELRLPCLVGGEGRYIVARQDA